MVHLRDRESEPEGRIGQERGAALIRAGSSSLSLLHFAEARAARFPGSAGWVY